METTSMPTSLDYAKLYNQPEFEKYSNKNYSLILSNGFCKRPVRTDKFIQRWGTLNIGLGIDHSDKHPTKKLNNIIYFVPDLDGDKFCYSGIDKPFIIEEFDPRTSKHSIEFCYIENSVIKKVSPLLHAEIYTQMLDCYTKLVEMKSIGLSPIEAYELVCKKTESTAQ